MTGAVEPRAAGVPGIRELDAGRLYAMDAAGYALDDALMAGATDLRALLEQVCKIQPTAITPDADGAALVVRRAGGGYLCARGHETAADAPVALVRARSADAYASLGLVDTGWAGCGAGARLDGLPATAVLPFLVVEGMNEKGLFAAVSKRDGAPTRQRTGKPAASTTVLLRLALDRAGSVGEAIALFAAYDMQSAAEHDFQFQLADATGRAAVVAYADGVMRVRDAAMTAETPDADAARAALVRAALAYRDDTLTRTDAMALLRLLRRDTTRWSAVYDLSDRALDVAVHRDYTRVYHFSLYGNLEGMWS